LAEAKVECPVCSEKMSISARSCPNCHAIFQDAEPEQVEEEPTLSAEELELLGAMVRPDPETPSQAERSQGTQDEGSKRQAKDPAKAPKPTKPAAVKKKRAKVPVKETSAKAPEKKPSKTLKKPAKKASPKKKVPKKSTKTSKQAKAKKKR